MGEWKTVFDGVVEERPVVVKIYDSEDDESKDVKPAVRVTTGPIGEGVSAREQNEQAPLARPEELIEVGFSPEAAARIVVPQ